MKPKGSGRLFGRSRVFAEASAKAKTAVAAAHTDAMQCVDTAFTHVGFEALRKLRVA